MERPIQCIRRSPIQACVGESIQCSSKDPGSIWESAVHIDRTKPHTLIELMLLSGRSLACRCKWNCCPRYKELRKFNYLTARHGDTVFVNLDFVSNFTSQFVVFGIRKKFVIVCQNSDRPFNEMRLRQLAPYALHIYSINCVIQHPMVTAVPIGFGDWSIEFLPSHPRPDVSRDIEILAGFKVETNPALRQPCLDAMKQDPRAFVGLTEYRAEFYDRIWRSKYVACPEGEGHDTHRLYESIYFGAIPILLRGNPLTPMYERLNLPIKWVDSWSDIQLDYETDKARLDEWVAANPDWAVRQYM